MQELIKNQKKKKKKKKTYLIDYNLLIVQGLWQAHYQIMLIILLKEWIKLNVNMDSVIKKNEACRIKYKDCECFLEYTNFKDDLAEYKCLCCKKNYQKKFDGNLKKRFFNTYKFSGYDNNKFNLLWKGAYPYEYMDDWEKFNKTSLPEKEDFYSHLNMEDIPDADHVNGKEFVKVLK